MDDLVSVIMPNYNCGKYIEESILSVLGQTYKNLELIVVDDCSTDNSVEIVTRLASSDGRIKLLVNSVNGGAAAARNRALLLARGRWIAFLDSDDRWTADKLERQIAFMLGNGYSFSCTKYRHIDEQSERTGTVVTCPKTLGKRRMFNYCYPGCLTVMYDSEVIGLLQINELVGNGENDYALWLKAVRKAKCYYLDEILAEYRIRQGSLSHGNRIRLIKYQYELMKYSEGCNSFVCCCYVVRRMFFGFFKKLIHVKKNCESV